MKLAILTALTLLCGSANATVTFSGNFSSLLGNADNSARVPAGTRFVMVVDTASNGFGASTQGGGASGVLAVGGSFGGDEIVGSGTTTLASGRAPASIINNTLLEVAPYAGKQFAIYWFAGVTGTSIADGDAYGFYRDAGWVVPSAAGTYTFASDGSGNFIQNATNLGAGLSVGAGPVPEPSRFMLGLLGFIGIVLHRRRNR